MNAEERARLDDELAKLNAAVKDALAARTAWMDAHMPDYAKYQVGEEIYNRETGKLLGTISSLYRYYAENPLYDTAMDVSYEYKTGVNCFDNTSRQPYTSICSRSELAAKLKFDALVLERGISAVWQEIRGVPPSPQR